MNTSGVREIGDMHDELTSVLKMCSSVKLEQQSKAPKQQPTEKPTKGAIDDTSFRMKSPQSPMSLLGMSHALLNEKSKISRAASCPSASTLKKERSVKFSKDVIIREHNITLGDQPWRGGPPVTLSWEQLNTCLIDLDEFENVRAGCRRTEPDLRIGGKERRNLLKTMAGFSDSDLLKAQRIKTHLRSDGRRRNLSGRRRSPPPAL
uniref:Uncharacterized protein n=1 Tax=Grammatophora oceanica TaxID=210454 RepID=A0A7S1V7D4_9STRA